MASRRPAIKRAFGRRATIHSVSRPCRAASGRKAPFLPLTACLQAGGRAEGWRSAAPPESGRRATTYSVSRPCRAASGRRATTLLRLSAMSGCLRSQSDHPPTNRLPLGWRTRRRLADQPSHHHSRAPAGLPDMPHLPPSRLAPTPLGHVGLPLVAERPPSH